MDEGADEQVNKCQHGGWEEQSQRTDNKHTDTSGRVGLVLLQDRNNILA